MDIRQIVEQDGRIIAIKEEYKVLIAKKQAAIIEISNIEADIIKLQGKYEATAQEIVKPFVPQTPAEVVADENATPVVEGPVSEPEPTAETDRPVKDEE